MNQPTNHRPCKVCGREIPDPPVQHPALNRPGRRRNMICENGIDNPRPGSSIFGNPTIMRAPDAATRDILAGGDGYQLEESA